MELGVAPCGVDEEVEPGAEFLEAFAANGAFKAVGKVGVGHEAVPCVYDGLQVDVVVSACDVGLEYEHGVHGFDGSHGDDAAAQEAVGGGGAELVFVGRGFAFGVGDVVDVDWPVVRVVGEVVACAKATPARFLWCRLR